MRPRRFMMVEDESRSVNRQAAVQLLIRNVFINCCLFRRHIKSRHNNSENNHKNHVGWGICTKKAKCLNNELVRGLRPHWSLLHEKQKSICCLKMGVLAFALFQTWFLAADYCRFMRCRGTCIPVTTFGQIFCRLFVLITCPKNAQSQEAISRQTPCHASLLCFGAFKRTVVFLYFWNAWDVIHYLLFDMQQVSVAKESLLWGASTVIYDQRQHWFSLRMVSAKILRRWETVVFVQLCLLSTTFDELSQSFWLPVRESFQSSQGELRAKKKRTCKQSFLCLYCHFLWRLSFFAMSDGLTGLWFSSSDFIFTLVSFVWETTLIAMATHRVILLVRQVMVESNYREARR